VKKAKELLRVTDLPSKAPKQRKDDIPHWKVWRWAIRNPGRPWRKEK
jgi:hypothetical protein